MELAEKTVVITGAGTGIGRALAVEFARHGAKAVCCGRRWGPLDETVHLIEQAGGAAIAAAVDITDHAQVRDLYNRIGNVDVLFNNAGSFQSIAGVHEVDPEVWWRDVTINLYGAMLMIREALPRMIERDRGVIINMNGGRPVGGSGYACGKAGLMELTRLLNAELRGGGGNVMVFSAGPGLVRTPMTELQAQTEAGRRWIPSTQQAFEQGRTRQPEDIARATVAMLRVATAAFSGKSYGPDTDFADWK